MRASLLALVLVLIGCDCPAGRTRCSNGLETICSDTSVDILNCGRCGNACIQGREYCKDGTCVPCTLQCAAPMKLDNIACRCVCANASCNSSCCENPSDQCCGEECCRDLAHCMPNGGCCRGTICGTQCCFGVDHCCADGSCPSATGLCGGPGCTFGSGGVACGTMGGCCFGTDCCGGMCCYPGTSCDSGLACTPFGASSIGLGPTYFAFAAFSCELPKPPPRGSKR